MTDLFRTEAVAHQQQKLLGTIILRQTWPTLALTTFFGVLVCGLIAVFFLFGFARRETLTGRLIPEGGLIQASSPQPGLVQQTRVLEGQTVKAGELLFVMSGERQGSRGPTLERVASAMSEQRELLRAEVKRAKKQSVMTRQALQVKLQQVRAQLAQLRAGLEVQRRRVELVNETYQRHAQLQASGAVSRPEVELKHAEALEQEARLHAQLREEATIKAEREAIKADLLALPTRTQREVAGIEGNLNTLSQAEAENDTKQSWEVRATRAGRITVVAVEPGQPVAAGDLLASIAPDGAALEAVLYAPSRAAGQLKAGMSAQVRFDALPYQKFGQFPGQISAVSRSPVPVAEVLGTALHDGTGAAATNNTPMYRVRVHLGEQKITPELAAALKAGMQLEATLTLEHRRFYEWVLEPLLGIKGRM